jgi:hypothetical protein
MECAPTDKVEVVIEVWPETSSDPLPIDATSSLKTMVPVGAPANPLAEALKVTGCPKTEGVTAVDALMVGFTHPVAPVMSVETVTE